MVTTAFDQEEQKCIWDTLGFCHKSPNVVLDVWENIEFYFYLRITTNFRFFLFYYNNHF